MILSKLKTVAMLLLVALCATGSGLLIARAIAGDKKSEQSPTATPRRAIVRTTVEVLWNTYNSNEALADQKFTGREVEVSGILRQIRRVEGVGKENPRLLDNEGAKIVYILRMVTRTGTQLWFQFDAKDQERLATLKPLEQEVTIRGQCSGGIGIIVDGKIEHVIFVRSCGIVNVRKPSGKTDAGFPG